MPRAGNLDEAGGVRKGRGKSTGLAACDKGIVAAVNDEHRTVHPRRGLAAVQEISLIALERGTGARGLRSVVEAVLEGVLFDPETGVRYVITEKTIRDGEAVKQSMVQMRAPLRAPPLSQRDSIVHACA